jgi:hypothetical protein
MRGREITGFRIYFFEMLENDGMSKNNIQLYIEL